MRRLFSEDDEALRNMLKAVRDQVVEAATSIVDDCAAKPGEQVGEKVLPEPFSKTQLVQRRLGGGEEIDGCKRPRWT